MTASSKKKKESKKKDFQVMDDQSGTLVTVANKTLETKIKGWKSKTKGAKCDRHQFPRKV